MENKIFILRLSSHTSIYLGLLPLYIAQYTWPVLFLFVYSLNWAAGKLHHYVGNSCTLKEACSFNFKIQDNCPGQIAASRMLLPLFSVVHIFPDNHDSQLDFKVYFLFPWPMFLLLLLCLMEFLKILFIFLKNDPLWQLNWLKANL